MKKAKAKHALALTVITTFSVFSGCSKELPSSKIQTSAVPELPPYEIQWYYIGPGEQKDTELVEQRVNEYIKPKINATIKLNLLDWETYPTRISAMIASGQPFDICFTSDWLNNYVKNAQDGAFVELDQYMDKELAGTKKIIGEEFWNGSKVNGKHYGIPANKEKARHYGFIFNKTLADELGFDMSKVKNFEDIEPLLKIVKEKKPDYTPLMWQNPGVGASFFIPWTCETPYNYGQAVAILPNGKAVNAMEQPQMKDAFEISRRFYLAGYYRKDALTTTDNSIIDKQGKFFAYNVNLKPGYADEKNSTLVGYETAQIDITPIITSNSDAMGSLQAISRTSKDPRRAAMFLELVNTDKTLSNLINYGIEGIHYTKISDNVIETVKDSKYTPNMQWMFGNQFLTYQYENEDPNKWKNFEEYNKKAIPAINLGFIFDQEPVKVEAAAVAEVMKQYFQALNLGAVDPAEKLPEFNAKLKEAGIDKIVAETQRQFDNWKASKK
jgi:putative aldouronate transport system substrate-binding protein